MMSLHTANFVCLPYYTISENRQNINNSPVLGQFARHSRPVCRMIAANALQYLYLLSPTAVRGLPLWANSWVSIPKKGETFRHARPYFRKFPLDFLYIFLYNRYGYTFFHRFVTILTQLIHFLPLKISSVKSHRYSAQFFSFTCLHVYRSSYAFSSAFFLPI